MPDPVSPLRPGAGWFCAKCKEPATMDPKPTLDPRIGIAPCSTCNKPKATYLKTK